VCVLVCPICLLFAGLVRFHFGRRRTKGGGDFGLCLLLVLVVLLFVLLLFREDAAWLLFVSVDCSILTHSYQCRIGIAV